MSKPAGPPKAGLRYTSLERGDCNNLNKYRLCANITT